MSRGWDIGQKLGGFVGALAGGAIAFMGVSGAGTLGTIAVMAVGATLGGAALALAGGAIGSLFSTMTGGSKEEHSTDTPRVPSAGVKREKDGVAESQAQGIADEAPVRPAPTPMADYDAARAR